MYLKGQGVEPDLAVAAQWLTKCAEKENAQAQFHLAEMCLNGEGVAVDAQVANDLYQKTLAGFLEIEKENSNASQEYPIATVYEKGLGTEVDLPKAIHWFTIAADNCHAHAAYCLGKLYLHGEGVEKDNVTAFHWFLKAAEQEERNAYYAVGQMYFDGTGIAQDYTKAAIWLEKASNEDLPYADYKLGQNVF